MTRISTDHRVPAVVVILDWACTNGCWNAIPVGVADSFEQGLRVAAVMVEAWNRRRPVADRLEIPGDPASAVSLYQSVTGRRIRLTTCGYYVSPMVAEQALLGRYPDDDDAFDNAPGDTLTSTTIDIERLQRTDPISGEH